jgi:hypothetical protein
MGALYEPESPSPLTRDSSVGAVIAEFLRTIDAGGAQRRLRSALSHVDAELGSMPVRNVRTRHVTALIDDLRQAGLSPSRQTAVLEALRALFAFAAGRRLVTVDPLGEPARSPASTPTLAMLAVGARVAFWTAWLIFAGFLALLLLLLVELG